MTPVYKLSANSVKNGRTVYGSMLAGNTAFIPASFESIATVNITDDTTATIVFDNIPQTYTHLQLRGTLRNAKFAYATDFVFVEYNDNTDSSKYNYHILQGNGTTASALASASSKALIIHPANRNGSDNFSSFVMDVFDYTNTNKFKPVRVLNGWDSDADSVGDCFFTSSVYESTSAITKINLTEAGVIKYKNLSQIALYGIKAVA